MKLLLNEHKAYPWIKKYNKMFCRGNFFFEGNFFEKNKLLDIYPLIETENDFLNFLKKVNGNFSVGIKKNNKYFIASDRINSFTLFYMDNNDEFIIGDDIKNLIKYLGDQPKIKEQSLLEVAAMGYTLGNKTLYDGIVLLGPGEYLVIDLKNKTIDKKNYFVHTHTEKYNKDENFLLEELDSVIERTFDRLVESLKDRQVVLFLSGGYDSRLILMNLHKRKYRNVICVSLRSRDDLDVQVARTIATKMGYRFISVEFNKKYWKKKSLKPDFWTLVDDMFNGVAIYYPQGLVVNDLKEEQIIDSDSVILTGNSGDVVEGNDVSNRFVEGETYSKREIICEIINSHGINVLFKKENYNKIFNEINISIEDKKIYTFSEAQDIFECFNWRERQCKYVTSDVRNYDDISGNEWRLPLWDNEFVDFWLNVPMEYRYKRKLYYLYVKNDNMPTANVETSYNYFRNIFVNNCKTILDYAYFIRQVIGYLSRELSFSFCGVASLYEWIIVLWLTRKNKVKFISVWIYKLFLKKYNINIFYRFK